MKQFEVEKTKLNTKYGVYNFYCFSWGKHEEDNILVLENKSDSDTPLVRVQSACYTAEIFRSLDCDCHAQLSTSQKLISKESGLLIYMLVDGRGAGLLNKIKGMELGFTHNLDTSEAYKFLGLEQDPREYDRVYDILSYFKIKKIKLLTNNPRKVSKLENIGISVTRIPLEIRSTNESKPYLKTKASKMGHMLSEFDT
ncbi:MAG: GTP cyclohydrolase II [Aliarcobacter skirrowii]|uniref:GTP cyclohydrolase II n=1 Tax=Aliarcobacter skirrowii TaxID=28200 RepID=UPI002433002F|nr:GTP cyclohydrolase II [Aliarcobacter skirrowii]MDD2509281.1 GTP cyclohydrolase II [Aliarcobacter skirrowii]MDD3497409.1 GTP cyclohydrolase II [Aliarcobacter skirrowii]